LIQYKQVNIITATKVLAERIAYFSFQDNVIEKEEDAVEGYSNSINLLTGDTDISFKIGQNNIGTALKQELTLLIIQVCYLLFFLVLWKMGFIEIFTEYFRMEFHQLFKQLEE